MLVFVNTKQVLGSIFSVAISKAGRLLSTIVLVHQEAFSAAKSSSAHFGRSGQYPRGQGGHGAGI
jgi:hypothetical protein